VHTAQHRPMCEAVTTPRVGDLAGFVPSWARSLWAPNRSPKTLTTYVGAANQLISFLAAKGMPTDAAKVRREHVEAFIEDVLARCRPATASNRYRALARFFAYLVEEGEVAESPMVRMSHLTSPTSRSLCWVTTAPPGCWRRARATVSRSAVTWPSCAFSSTAAAPRRTGPTCASKISTSTRTWPSVVGKGRWPWACSFRE
jgi:hypothetical protein